MPFETWLQRWFVLGTLVAAGCGNGLADAEVRRLVTADLASPFAKVTEFAVTDRRGAAEPGLQAAGTDTNQLV